MVLKSPKTIVFIDDDCIFCNFWGHFILKNDYSGSIYISPSKSEYFQSIKNRYNNLPNPKETIILYHNEIIYEKSNAVIKIAVLMRNWHSILFLTYIIPKFLRNSVYDLISKKRKSLMKDRCVIDELKKKEKYIL